MLLRRSASTIILAAILEVGCGSSGSTATQSPQATGTTAPTQTTGGATTAPTSTPGGGGGGGGTGIPTIVAGTWSNGKAHVEITGGRTVTFDAVGPVFSPGGTAVAYLADTVSGHSVQFTLSNQDSSGVSITGPGLLLGGTWGEDCQITITRNEPSGLGGEFSCASVEGVDTTSAQSFRVDITGTFSATP